MNIKELIESKVVLKRTRGNGYHPFRCQVCNDHSERAGFKFELDSVFYNCFNCAISGSFKDGTTKLTQNMRKILHSIGVSNQEINSLLSVGFFSTKKEEIEISIETLKKKVIFSTPTIELPKNSFPIGYCEFKDVQQPILDYLGKRKIDSQRLNIHFSINPTFLGRAIIPCYKDGNLIFWQARSIVKDEKKYISPNISRSAVLWGYDNIWTNWNTPLFITEGIFDAYPLNGVALLTSRLVENDAKLEILNKTKRRKIVVIDRNKNGEDLANYALGRGWDVTYPPIETDDINHSIVKHGLIYTTWCLLQQASSKPISKIDEARNKLELQFQMMMAKKRGN